ncbi:hypothetical protein FNH22_27195 [Fulvivirga sp. M361]|uniref:hypothetical protein n=1 Tax=Fulvivirga sp. M361 TaxID=2594266 RepID=UPI00117AD5BB|nr:hypothetical protein [Fulvivirga sp. M361]TRX49315.1 hypothetical protein FNH22_27195 [Fulvivirga sp. M361]
MKKVLLFLFASIVMLSVNAQDDDDEMKTLFGRKSEVRGFGSFDIKVTEFNNENALFLGGHGGVILNKHFILGGGGYGLTTKNDFEVTNDNITEKFDLFGGYGGLVLGYIIAPKEIIHVSFPILIGAGGVEVVDDSRPIVNDLRATIERSAFFVVEPSVEIEMNITGFLRISANGGYRYVEGVDLDVNNISNNDLSSWTAGVSFKFGKF